MTPVSLSSWAWRSRAEREPAPGLSAQHSPFRSRGLHGGLFSFAPMTVTTDIATDLLTPLGAYLRLRGGPARAGRSCSSRSSAGGSAATRSSVAARASSTSPRRSGSGEPVVGYLGYDVVAKLEPTVPLPVDGPGLPESLFVVPERLVRFDHARGVAQVLAGDADELAGILAGPRPELARGTGERGPLRRFPDRDEHLRRVERAKEYIREGDVFQVVVSQRAERPTSASAAELYRALRRVNPSPYLFLLELGRPRARRQLARDGRQVRGQARGGQPDRGHDRAGRGRRGGAALVREGPRRARDARRPRPQRPLARLRARDRCASSSS